MKTIEIISHCYAVHLPHYANALCYQLSSLVLDIKKHPSEYEVIATICCDINDENTRCILDWFDELYNKFFGRLTLKIIHLDPPHLGRRAIGRNFAAKNTDADIIWFADVDQVYRNDCLYELALMEWPDNAVMIYPKNIKIHKDHATGDKATNLVNEEPKLVEINSDDFINKRYRKAIGGVQIVKGDFAREHGYLDKHKKWQKPTEKPFSNFRDDLAYRGFCNKHGRIIGVDLPGMFRIRHTTTTH